MGAAMRHFVGVGIGATWKQQGATCSARSTMRHKGLHERSSHILSGQAHAQQCVQETDETWLKPFKVPAPGHQWIVRFPEQVGSRRAGEIRARMTSDDEPDHLASLDLQRLDSAGTLSMSQHSAMRSETGTPMHCTLVAMGAHGPGHTLLEDHIQPLAHSRVWVRAVPCVLQSWAIMWAAAPLLRACIRCSVLTCDGRKAC